ncbi:MAG TPA: 4a-hydroxytetrahydrobiopterin dehydratase [Candidatus Limnocylindrales bacterium]|nr:4a-hydroxytetrahydrobiopterin dehydratase [Candidatus Limnocylindrales bacterium]
MPPLTGEQAGELAAALDPAWDLGEGELRRTLRLRDFNAALGLAVRIGLIAEDQGHHPDLDVGWGRLGIRLTTHAIGGLSTNDFVMAAKIDRLLARGLGLREDGSAVPGSSGPSA